MILRRLAFALFFVAAPVMAQAVPDIAPVRPATVKVRLETSAGPIVLELEKARAPLTTANFLHYVDQKRLDGTTFYRALKFPADAPLGLVQGGVRGAGKRVLPPVAHESTSKTGLTHDNGAISMARAGVGTANGDFFIIIGNLVSLDANPEAAGDKDGYAVFGHVVEGMENVTAIQAKPVSPTAGDGAMKGQMIETPVTITSARRLR